MISSIFIYYDFNPRQFFNELDFIEIKIFNF